MHHAFSFLKPPCLAKIFFHFFPKRFIVLHLNLYGPFWLCTKELMTWATVSSRSCLCWLYRVSSSLAARHVINQISVLIILWCSCIESSLALLEEGKSWTIKKAERWRIDAFELWCWRRLLRVTWTARRSNRLILKQINPEYSLEGLMLKLKLQYFGHLMQRANSLEKILMQRKIEGRGEVGNTGWDGWMASLTQWTWVWASSGSWWWTGKPGVLQSMGSQRDMT